VLLLIHLHLVSSFASSCVCVSRRAFRVSRRAFAFRVVRLRFASCDCVSRHAIAFRVVEKEG
jgi:hypothetical protein